MSVSEIVTLTVVVVVAYVMISLFVHEGLTKLVASHKWELVNKIVDGFKRDPDNVLLAISIAWLPSAIALLVTLGFYGLSEVGKVFMPWSVSGPVNVDNSDNVDAYLADLHDQLQHKDGYQPPQNLGSGPK